MEYGEFGWRWSDTKERVYQEEQLLPDSALPIGHSDYGKPTPTQREQLGLRSMSDGFWVMDNLGSYHKHPFRTKESAEAYLSLLRKG